MRNFSQTLQQKHIALVNDHSNLKRLSSAAVGTRKPSAIFFTNYQYYACAQHELMIVSERQIATAERRIFAAANSISKGPLNALCGVVATNGSFCLGLALVVQQRVGSG